MIKYNSEQEKAITYPAKPLLILAGAGTGKTTTIVGRIAHLIENDNAKPETILALTFTEDAAKHLKKILTNKIGIKGNDIQACTFHSFAQSMTMKYFKKLGYSRPPMIMNRGDAYFLIHMNFDSLDRFLSKIYRRNPAQAIQSFQKIFGALRYNLLDNEEIQEHKNNELYKITRVGDEKTLEPTYQLIDIADTFPKYQSWKKKWNWIDYGDMILNLWILIEKHSDIRNQLQQSYQHVIIDEFQDNNYALSQIMEKIAEPENSITVVGDDDQCIYAFRQANIQNVHKFNERYYSNNHKPISLMKNYRSTQSILNIANSVIRHNGDRMSKSELKSSKSGQIPRLYIGSENEQLYQIAGILKTFLKDGENPNKIAILLRSHVKCRLVEEYLTFNGINTDYHVDKLFEQSIIKDIVSLFNIWAKTEKSEHAFLRLLGNILGSKIIASLSIEFQNDKSELSIIDYALSKKNIIGETAYSFLKPIYQIKTDNTKKLMQKLLKVEKVYNVKDLNDHEMQKKMHIINQFRNIVSAYSQNYSAKGPYEFVEFINIQKEINDEPMLPFKELEYLSAVKIMTIHGAKGQEFKHVIIPFLRSGTFPHRYSNMSIIDRLPISWQRWDAGSRDERILHYEEERRLFYVSITRAMETLTLLAPPKYQSSFIKELEEDQFISEKIIKTKDLLDKKSIKNAVGNIIDNIDEVSQTIKPSLSATGIKTYMTCPLQYKYRYVDCIPTTLEKPYFKLGMVVHKVLEIFHNNKRSTYRDLIDILEDKWDESVFHYKQEEEQYREDAILMLKNYWNYIQFNQIKILYTEYQFSFETQFAYFNGKCDRIDLDEENNIVIIDYKTSKKSLTVRELRKDLQLGIYAMFVIRDGIQLNGNIYRGLPKKLSMLFLREDKPEVSVVFTLEDIDKFDEQIRDISENIKRGKFTPYKSRHCDWCDYKDIICPEFG